MPFSLIHEFIGKAHFNSIIKNGGWLLFDKIFRLITSLFVGIYLARYLGPMDFGLLNYAMAYVAIFSVIANLGLDSIVIKELSAKPELDPVILGSAWVLKIMGAIFSIVLGMSTVIFFGSSNGGLLLIIVLTLSLGGIFQTADVIDFIYQAKMKAKLSTICRSGAFFIASLVKLFLIYIDASLIAITLASLLEFVISAVSFVYTYQLTGGEIRKWIFKKSEALRLLKEGWPLFFSGILVLIYLKIDQVMIGSMLGNTAVGIYSVAVKLSEVWYFIPTAITAAVFPAIVKLKGENELAYSKVLEYLYLLMMWLSVLVAIPLTFFSSFIVDLLFGNSYAEASTVLQIQCWSGIFIFSGLVSNQWYLLNGKSHYIFYRNALGVFINIVLNFFLIPIYGIEGSAFATLVTQIIVSYLFDLINPSTRHIFYLRTKIYLFFIPITYKIIINNKTIFP
jgi:PST family polysaccharide transporter